MTGRRRKMPWLYVVLAYGLAWVFWIPVALTGHDYQESPLLMVAVFAGVFGPGLAGIILTYSESGREGGRDFWRRAFDLRRIKARWYLVILLVWPVMHLAAIALGQLFGQDLPDLALLQDMADQPIQVPIVMVLYFLQAWLEELGWRGYMLDRLQPGRGPLRASLIVGVFHAFWHLPMFWVVGTNQIEMGFGLDFALFVAAAVSSSLYMTWCYNDNGRSTMAASLFHAVGNLSIDALTDGPGTLQFRLYTLIMVAGAVAIAVMWARGGTRETEPAVAEGQQLKATVGSGGVPA